MFAAYLLAYATALAITIFVFNVVWASGCGSDLRPSAGPACECHRSPRYDQRSLAAYVVLFGRWDFW
jgi:hypothetical protein